MKILWLCPPSKVEGEYPLVGQNRWFKYLPFKANFIYPIIAAEGVTLIKNAGHEIDFLEAPAEQKSMVDVLQQIWKKGYDLVIMEGRTAIITWIWQVAKTIKSTSIRTKVALYGDHVIVRPHESLQNGIDYIIDCGDYDYGAFKLVEELSKTGYANPIFSENIMKNLDDLPFADRDLVPWHNYFESWRHRDKFGWYQSGRGCWAKCTFCSWVYTFYGHTIRLFSPKRIADEVQYATEKWGIEEYLDDADTFIPKPWGVQFAKELEGREIEILWNVQTRADTALTANESDWKLMRDSGLRVVKLGVDGGNEYTLNKIQKGYRMEDAENAVKLLKKAGIEVHINMIIGWPWETKKEAYGVIKWVKRLKPNQAQFSLIEPFIGTPIFQEAIDNKWFVNAPQDWDKYDMKTPILQGEMSAKEIAKLHRDAWKMFYLNPRFIIYQLEKSTKLAFEERNLDSFRHIWRGYKGVTEGHMKAVSTGDTSNE
jgi:radical SAM superfamily enzyme YgiQ (UPF0313 family)